MQQHPDVFVPARKELHYFSCPEVSDNYYEGPFVTTESEYLEAYAARTHERAAGDFSPSYLFYSEAAQRIRAFRPDAKILILLRNPIKRAISHYLMDIRSGYQTRPLADFLQRTSENRLFHREYIELGMYSRQVPAYFQEFSPENVLLLLYDDFVRNPGQLMAAIFRFIGVSDEVNVETTFVHNSFEMPRLRILRKLMRSRNLEPVRRLCPQAVRTGLKRALFSRKRPDLSNEENLLTEIYRQEIAGLSRLIGHDLSSWLEGESPPALPTSPPSSTTGRWAASG